MLDGLRQGKKMLESAKRLKPVSMKVQAALAKAEKLMAVWEGVEQAYAAEEWSMLLKRTTESLAKDPQVQTLFDANLLHRRAIAQVQMRRYYPVWDSSAVIYVLLSS